MLMGRLSANWACEAKTDAKNSRYDLRMNRPVIGLEMDAATDDKHVTRCMLRINYLKAVIDAGGLPLLIPPEPALAQDYLAMCQGLILTGGDDPRTEPYDQPTHPRARPIEPIRQAM